MEFPWDLFTISIDSIGSFMVPWDVSLMLCDFIDFNFAVS